MHQQRESLTQLFSRVRSKDKLDEGVVHHENYTNVEDSEESIGLRPFKTHLIGFLCDEYFWSFFRHRVCTIAIQLDDEHRHLCVITVTAVGDSTVANINCHKR